MKAFGIEEYGNKDGFTIKCNLCGKEGWVVPIHHCENGQADKITLEFRCTCGNRYGATIHEHRNKTRNKRKYMWIKSNLHCEQVLAQ